MLLGVPMFGGAQESRATLDAYLSQGADEEGALYSATIVEWESPHPGEKVEGPAEKGDPRNAWQLSEREHRNRKLEGRWCLRSTAEIHLAGDILVRRIALFYQPLVELTDANPLPPLPTETGDALRKHGCKLVTILYEFEGAADPEGLMELIAKRMPGKRVEEPGKFIEFAIDDYWSPICSFEEFGKPLSYHHLFAHKSKADSPDDKPAVLLEWPWGTLEYGQPTSKTINPEAGQPWLALRAAKAARLPEGPTLDMLSFLAPQVGDTYEQRPFHCEKQLIPVLRRWMDLAARSPPEQHAAAILLAEGVLGRLWYCEEFFHTGSYNSPEEEKINTEDNAVLEKDLQELGIGTATGRLGDEYYAGNLRDEALKLAPGGVANQLGRMAILDDRCQWSGSSDSADCTNIIREGESFLKRFPEDEWTPSVHLILAEAYALSSANPIEQFSQPAKPPTDMWQKAAAHYRAWYAKSANERDRGLVWQEIWALEAGMGPWLMMPTELQQ